MGLFGPKMALIRSIFCRHAVEHVASMPAIASLRLCHMHGPDVPNLRTCLTASSGTFDDSF